MTPNVLSFIALANEYCQAVENANHTVRNDFVNVMLRLLPRIYITVSDIQEPSIMADTTYIPQTLSEDYYNSLRKNMESVLGEEDAFLEVFVDDMRYSETPIASSISEGLADIFQVLFNFIENVKDAPEEIILESVDTVKEDFQSYWSQIICNIMRPLNSIKYIQTIN